MAKAPLTPRGLETKRKILEAAIEVVSRKGLENCSVTEIAKRARVSRGLVPYHLPPQDRLLETLIHHVLERGTEEFGPIPEYRVSGVPIAMSERIAQNFRFFSENPAYFQIFMLFFYRATTDRKLRELNTQIYESVISSFSESLRERAIPEPSRQKLARRIYGWMFSEIQQLHILVKAETWPKRLPEFLKEVAETLR